MTVLVTGAAGFIGYHVADRLLARGQAVIGLDDLNPYYDPALKRARLAQLETRPEFRFVQADVSDAQAVQAVLADHPGITDIVHLAAQAGVRYSLEDPASYGRVNVMGQIALVEAARRLPGLRHIVYASSSSVYGDSRALPFSLDDRADRPVSVYAATKRSQELIAHAFSHLYALPMTGLRFFTVYGPWGRPDMAYWMFAEAMLDGRPIRVFNEGRSSRDFTWIGDIVDGVVAALDRVPSADSGAPHALYNLGSDRPETLTGFIATLERALGVSARLEFLPAQPGDVPATAADISASTRDLGFRPRTSIAEGLPRFAEWLRWWRGRPGAVTP